MKRLLLVLLIPTLSYSQITYEDIMSINSEKTFKRVVIEGGFEFNKLDNEYLNYGIDITKDSIDGDRSVLWGRYNKVNGEFGFKFSYGRSLFGIEFNDDDNPYDLIVEKIKKNCKFYDVIEEMDMDFVCYSCSQSKYKGKIGFTMSDGSGMIQHILPKKQITYNDIMSINSPKTFYKIVSLNGYDTIIDDDSLLVSVIQFGEDVVNDGVLEWMSYNKINDEFLIHFKTDNEERSYTKLTDDIKGNCTFYDTLKSRRSNFISYSCSESTYKGKIGYSITDSVSYIKHIIPKKPITFSDIMRINSPKTFNKIMNEKGYELDVFNDSTVYYGFNIGGDEDYLSSEWGGYYKNDDEFYFKFGYDDDYNDDFYNVIIDDIKKTCSFYDTLSGRNNRDYISYDCPQSTYKGKIGYTITDSVSYIRNIVPKEE
tara:strand:+ start:1187 stop:2464 length:1278 start_codon:yes stop_codon:yes gene_type:complete